MDAEEVEALLVSARDRIANYDNWCVGSYAKDVDGNEVMPGAPQACQHCAIGAIFASSRGPMRDRGEMFYARQLLSRHAGRLGIVGLNDRAHQRLPQVHRGVIAMFDAAIATANAARA